jgi:hypothetical protein
MINATFALRFVPGVDIRLTYIVTNMLTIVTFLFILNSMLPQIPYLTLVDKYMNLSFFYVMALSILCVLLKYYEIEEGEIEDYLFVFSIIGLIVFHILMGVYFRHLINLEKNKLTLNRHEVEEYEEKYMGVKDKEEFLVHTDIHKKGNHNVYEGTYRNRITPLEAAGWLFEGGGRVLKDGEQGSIREKFAMEE